jgi:hypothetical protein
LLGTTVKIAFFPQALRCRKRRSKVEANGWA